MADDRGDLWLSLDDMRELIREEIRAMLDGGQDQAGGHEREPTGHRAGCGCAACGSDREGRARELAAAEREHEAEHEHYRREAERASSPRPGWRERMWG